MKKAGVILGILIAVVCFVLAVQKQMARQKVAETNSVIAEIHSVIKEINQHNEDPKLHELCRFRWKYYQWRKVQHLMQKAHELGTDLSWEEVGGDTIMKRDAINFGYRLIIAFERNENVVCGDVSNQLPTGYGRNVPIPPTGYGRNLPTLFEAKGTFISANLDVPEQIVKCLIEYLNERVR